MNNMGNYKFKKGDRVRVVKIDDKGYYGYAKYKVGDVGTVVGAVGTVVGAKEKSKHGNRYNIDFDNLKHARRSKWWAKESWIQPDKALIVCE